jgi:DNA-binding transcriptional MerR regulator
LKCPCRADLLWEYNIFDAVPYKEKKIEKLYYSIGEIADMFNVNTSLIRYWEKEFDIIKPKKNKKGNRFFTIEDIDNFYLIHELVKVRGMTLRGAKKKLRENKDGAIKNMEIVKILKDVKAMLIEIKSGFE